MGLSPLLVQTIHHFMHILGFSNMNSFQAWQEDAGIISCEMDVKKIIFRKTSHIGVILAKNHTDNLSKFNVLSLRYFVLVSKILCQTKCVISFGLKKLL